MTNKKVTFRRYPVIISRPGETYRALCPDLQLGIEIHGADNHIAYVCGSAMSTVQMFCKSLKEAGIPLPPATPMAEAQKFQPENHVITIGVIVVQTEQDDICNDQGPDDDELD